MSYIVPAFETSLMLKGQTNRVWYRFFQALWQGTPPSNESKVVVGGSPFSYVVPSRGFVILSGGTVTAVQFTRSVTTLTGQTSGIFPMNQGDTLTVTYSALPSVTFVPQ